PQVHLAGGRICYESGPESPARADVLIHGARANRAPVRSVERLNKQLSGSGRSSFCPGNVRLSSEERYRNAVSPGRGIRVQTGGPYSDPRAARPTSDIHLRDGLTDEVPGGRSILSPGYIRVCPVAGDGD